MGRNKQNGISLLMSIALDKEAIRQHGSDSNAKCRCIALQILSACCSHVPFVLKHSTQVRASDLATIVVEACPNNPDVIISAIAVLLRLILTLTDDEHVDMHAAAPSICQICVTALTAFSSSHDSTPKDSTRVQHAVFDLLTAWVSTNHNSILSAAQQVDCSFLENTQQSQYYAQKRAAHHKTEDQVRKMKPRELSAYKQKECKRIYSVKRRSCKNAMLFCSTETGGLQVLLDCAVQIQNYSTRREIAVIISRLITAMDLDDEKEHISEDRIKQIVFPIFNSTAKAEHNNTSSSHHEEMKYDYDGVIIEEVHSDHEDDENQLDYTNSDQLKILMIKGQLTSSLLLAVSKIGIWALEKGWNNGKGLDQLQSLVHSKNKNAMSIAAECFAAAASVQKARVLITPLISQKHNNILQLLLQCDDGDIRSGAASTLAKIGLADKVMSHEEGEVIALLQLAADLLEESQDHFSNSINQNHSSATSTSSSSNSSPLLLLRDDNTKAAASTTIERAIELLSYLSSKTYVKEEITHAFQSPKSSKTVLQRLVELGNMPNAGELPFAFGLASTFAFMAVSTETLRKEAFKGKDITPEQYEQLQSMALTDDEKEFQENHKEEDDTSNEVSVRIGKMADCDVSSALVHMMDTGASETTKDQIVIAMMRMAVEPSIRGVMIQQGCLKASMSIETGDATQMTEKGKLILINAQHCIAKLLITTNPSLLTPVQRIGSIHPLIQLIRNHDASDLAIFEALLSICNLASLDDETKYRIISEKGISTLTYAMFSDHKDIRRAATEAMSNLIPHPDMMAHLADPDKLKLWLAFASDFDDHYECARAATGCLAMSTQDPKIANELTKLTHFKDGIRALLECGHLELMHRLLVILLNLLAHGGKCRTAVEETGAISFCKAYLDSYGGGRSNKKDELEFSASDQNFMEATLELSKEIVNYE